MVFELYGLQISYSWPSQPTPPSLLPLTVSSSSTNTSSNSILAKYSCADRVSKYVQNLRQHQQQQHQQQQQPQKRRNSSSYIIPPPPPMLPLTSSSMMATFGENPHPRDGSKSNNNNNSTDDDDTKRCSRSNWSDLSIAVMKLEKLLKVSFHFLDAAFSYLISYYLSYCYDASIITIDHCAPN